jgi:hypothetical protein
MEKTAGKISTNGGTGINLSSANLHKPQPEGPANPEDFSC